MDYFLLNKLRAKVLKDLKEFIPELMFTNQIWARSNGVDISDEMDYERAYDLSSDLLTKRQSSILTARQLTASEVLMYLSSYHISPTENNTELLRRSIQEYLCHFSSDREERSLFIPLLQKEPEATLKTKKQNQSVSVKKSLPGRKVNKQRRNSLDPAIDKAIENAGSSELEEVYLQLKELAKDEYPPFNGAFEGNALIYVSDENILKPFTKNALGKRLSRRSDAEN